MLGNRGRIREYVAAAGVALILVGAVASKGRADFTLRNGEQLTVDSRHSSGVLYDQSRARVVLGGSVTDTLDTYGTSTVDVSGGWVQTLTAYASSTVNLSQGWVSGSPGGYFVVLDDSTANISGGAVRRLSASDSSVVNITGGEVATFDGYLNPSGNSTVNISGGTVSGPINASGASTVSVSGGSVNYLLASMTSTVDISGGSLEELAASGDSIVRISGAWVHDLSAYDASALTVVARRFSLGPGLSLDGDRVMGTGFLIAESFDGKDRLVNITRNDSSATILAIVPGAQIAAPALDLQDGPPLETAIVAPYGDGKTGGFYGIWLRGEGIGGNPNYRWSISGGPEALPDTLLVDLPDTDLDGNVNDFFLKFTHLADVGANDRDATAPYTLRLEALDSGGQPIVGSESEILLLVPEPATLALMVLSGLTLVRRRKLRACK